MKVFEHVKFAAKSDVGRKRKNNEDNFGVFPDIRATAQQHFREISRVEPDPANAEIYARKKELYRDYVIRLHDFYLPLQK